jgi:hypothetical protein
VAFDATHLASFSDDLTNVLQNATYNGDADHGATYAAPTILWSGMLPVGGTTAVTYSVTLDHNAPAGTVLNNVVTTPLDPAGTVSNCIVPANDPRCAANVTVAADPATPRHEIAYTGSNIVPLLGGGIALLLAGLTIVCGRMIRRRRDLN